MLKSRNAQSSSVIPIESNGEPSRKKLRTNDNATKSKPDGIKKETTTPRCITGSVGQIVNFNKKYPNLDAFVEVYGKVFKVDCSKDRRKLLLIRSNSGPILQAIFWEIDIEMVTVKPGDAVRCVGKYTNNSWLNLFKVAVITESNYANLAARLFALSNFALYQHN